MPAAAQPPPPFSPLCTPFARKGGARGHVAPGPSLGRTALYRATRPPTPPFPICAGAHKGTPLRIAPAPSRSLFAPPHSREKGARDPPTPPFSIARRRGAHEGTPPPAPLARKGGCTTARRPRHLPSPLAAPPRMRGKGHEGHPVATGPSPSPFDRAALYARERGTRGYATPGPTLPIRTEGARTRGTSPPAPPFVRAALYTQERGAQGHAPRDPTLLIHAEGARTRDSPFPLAAPLRTRGQGAREAKPPHPVAPHSRGKGRTRPPASLRVVQQVRRCLRVPAFTAPAPRFRAPLYDLDKK
ncbi:hypothetical protein EDB85DRAFT_2165147 [Lactarius pseudohatsudake]|nr:hypothetical protein EDB85DRAFT_2165147 [Lactarius pseudohatsudake]